MKQLDFDRAFPQTPDCIHAAIELGFRKGQKKMKLQNKIIAFGSIAAALVIMFAAALATGGLNIAPQPDVLAQPEVTDMLKTTEISMVYCTEQGRYYHFDEHCSGMMNAKHRPLSEAQRMGKNACPVCVPAEYDGQTGKEPIEFIYYSEGSQYFHKDQTCAGETYPLKTETLNTFFATADAAVSKAPCPECLPYGITVIGDGAYVNLHKTPEITPAEPDPKAELFADATVFCTENGSYYHSYADCSGMLNASAISLNEAVDMGKETCPRCLGPAMVFTTPHGDYYHSEKSCSGMEDATAMHPEEALWWDKHPCPTCIIDKKVNVASCDMYYHESNACSAAEFYYDKYPLLDALSIGMTPCPECSTVEVTPEEENQDAFWAEADAAQEERVYAAYGQARYYHKAKICNGQENKRELTLAEAGMEKLDPCPDCYTVTAADENIEEAGIVFYRTPNGKYYHYEPDCSGMQNAEACTPEKAIVNTGKHACPVCFDTEEKKALYMLPVPWGDTDEVYVAVDNDYYHIDPDCFNMVMVSKMDLKSAKDFGKTVCPVCFKEYSDFTSGEQETCWATRNGKYYHNDQYCSGMEHAVSGPVVEAQAMGKLRCPVCIELDLEDYDLFTTAFGQDISDLYYGYNYDHSVGNEWIISNGTESFRLCEVYPEGMTFFGDEPPGIPELHLNGLSADPEQVHLFMKNAPAPIGDMYAAAPSEVEKLAYKGNLTAEEVQLQEVKVYFDANRQVSSCEMQFGFYDHVKLAWKVGADGQIEMTESKLVRPGWDETSEEAPKEAVVEVSSFTAPLPDESALPFLGTTTLLDALYQSAFGNLEEALDSGYGFMSKDSSSLNFSFIPKEENSYVLFGEGQAVLKLHLQEAANDSNLKYIMNVELYGTLGSSKSFMESVAAQPLVDLYPQAVSLAKEHLASTHKKDAEDFNPYVELMMIGLDETFWPSVIQLDFRRSSESDEVFGIEFTMVDGSHDNWKSRIVT